MVLACHNSSMANVTLLVTAEVAEARLNDLITEGHTLHKKLSSLDLPTAWNEWQNWNEKTKNALEIMYKKNGGILSQSPSEQFTASLNTILFSAKLSGIKKLKDADQEELRTTLPDELSERIRRLESFRSQLSDYALNYQVNKENTESEHTQDSIFIVHGRNDTRRLEVRNFIDSHTDLQPITLSDQPNKGLDLLGKFVENAQKARFAVVIVTGDDEGRIKGGKDLKPRARQNVIFELGYFIGLLGRDKVAVLYEDNTELPSDFGGIVYIPLSRDWKIQLGRELKNAGIQVDLNKSLSTN